MILFAKDWNQYPTAVPDYQTTNHSFIRYASLLKNMGVKNHTFMLALHDRSLVGIDPHSPNLTLEQQAAIAVECKVNFWYFVREVARVPPVSGAVSVKFRASRGNIAGYFLYFCHIIYILVQIRQTGKSVGTDILMSWLLNMGTSGSTINVLTLNDTLRTANLERLKNIFEYLPPYLNLRTNKDIGNTERLTVSHLKNEYVGHVPSLSAKQAEMKGRGLTAATNQVDEFGLIPNVSISVPAMLNSGGAARELAEANREPYGTILTTTAGKRDDPDGAFAYNFIESAAMWTEAFFDARDIDELEQMIRRNSAGGKPFVNVTLNHAQLGYSDEWLEKRIEASLGTGEGGDIDRDLFNIWTFGSDVCPIPKDILATMRTHQKADYHAEVSKDGYIVRWYIPKESIMNRLASTHVIVGLDTSDASGGDDISLVMLDMQTGECLCAGNYNETNLITFSKWLSEWFIKYENLTLIPERRSTGSAVIDYLILQLTHHNIDPFKRIFNWVVNDPNQPGNKERYKEIIGPHSRRPRGVYDMYKRYFGFATSGSGATSRRDLYTVTLRSAYTNIGASVYDKKTVDQLSGLIEKNGRIDHRPGAHDDLVIAWLLAYWFMINAQNLSFYGIDSSKILRNNISKPVERVEDKSVKLFREEQMRYREKAKKLYEEMKQEDDQFILFKLENELRDLNSRIVLEEGETFSVDDLIKNLNEGKKIKRAQLRDRYDRNRQNVYGGISSTSRSHFFG